MIDRMRQLMMRVGWPRAAAVALILLWLTSPSPFTRSEPGPSRPTAPMQPHSPAALPASELEGPAVSSQEGQLRQYENIVPVRTRDEEQLFLLTYSFPNAGESIKCVDAETG